MIRTKFNFLQDFADLPLDTFNNFGADVTVLPGRWCCRLVPYLIDITS
jgi:hypothetical protein